MTTPILDDNGREIRGYALVIHEATQITNRDELEEIEDIMRHTIFHSTLDWQTREQLHEAAKLAVEVMKADA